MHILSQNYFINKKREEPNLFITSLLFVFAEQFFTNDLGPCLYLYIRDIAGGTNLIKRLLGTQLPC